MVFKINTMKLYFKLLKVYYKIISFLAPKLGGKIAFKLFQRVRKKNVRKREQGFYKKARHFKVPFLNQDLNCYELGDVKGELIFLVHGWDSNAGSMAKFAFELAKRDYRVLSFDLPGHAHAASDHTNLYECKEAFKSLINFIQPKDPFTIVAHSFGSALTAYTLSTLNYKVDKFVFLTSPNALLEVFTNFKNFVGISDKTFSYMLKNAEETIREEVQYVNVQDKLKNISFTKLLLVHDRADKILPYRNSQEIMNANHSNTELKTYDKIGHYRMLWNEDVLKDTLSFITEN